jgi:hypothetical protein
LFGFVLLQLGTNPRQQHRELERLDDIVVGARFETQDNVRVRAVPGQHDDRRHEPALSQHAHRLSPVDIGEPYIHDDEINLAGSYSLHAFGSALNRSCFDSIVQGEMFDQKVAHGGIIADNHNLPDACHRFLTRKKLWLTLRDAIALVFKNRRSSQSLHHRRPEASAGRVFEHTRNGVRSCSPAVPGL